MDGHGFDELTKALAMTTSRRVALQGLGGGLLGRLLSLFGDHCPRAFERCHNLCVPAGWCCGGDDCGGSACVPATSCPNGQTCGTASDGCGGVIQCGTCAGGTACSPVACSNGQCVRTPIDGCCTGDRQCDDGDACSVDTCTPATNTCSHAPASCQASDACHAASCDPSQGCVQTAVADGTDCGGGKTCQGGACTCPTGTKDCGGSCQQCCTVDDCPGSTCSPATCTAGVCGRSPIAGCCTDDSTCDDGNPCSIDTCALTTNTCTHADAGDDTACGAGQACCGGACTDITTTSHCGTCGNGCGDGDTCQGGTCVAPCVAKTCADYPGQCGSLSDGCNGTLDCGCANGGSCQQGMCTCAAGACGTDCSLEVCGDGSCRQAVGGPCTDSGDCCSDVCSEGVCQSTCDCSNFNNCSGHGHCSSACVCVCDAPYIGIACSDLPFVPCDSYTTCTECNQHRDDGCVFCDATLDGAGSGEVVCTTVDNCVSLAACS